MSGMASRYWVRGALVALSSIGAIGLAQAGDVGVSVNINAPGIYGQIILGGLPAPELILPQPVIVVPARVVLGLPAPEPLYLHVPPGHEKHWSRHCHEYNACGRPVYFVSDRWYQEVYTPRLERHHDDGDYEDRDGERWREHDHGRDHEHEHGHKEGHDHGRGHDHGDDRD